MEMVHLNTPCGSSRNRHSWDFQRETGKKHVDRGDPAPGHSADCRCFFYLARDYRIPGLCRAEKYDLCLHLPLYNRVAAMRVAGLCELRRRCWCGHASRDGKSLTLRALVTE